MTTSIPDQTLRDSTAGSDITSDKDQMISDIISLRRIVEDLHDQREEDRQSIRILQSQIDSMRDAKCSDSFEQTLQSFKAAATSLWNQFPSISLDAVFTGIKRKKRKVFKGLSVSGASYHQDPSHKSETDRAKRKMLKQCDRGRIHGAIPRDS